MKFSSTLLTIALILSACTPVTPSATDPHQISVVASIYPLAFLAEAIGGDHVRVTTITPPGTEPHEYEPNPRQVALIEDASIFLWNGEGIDPWAKDIDERVKGTIATVQATSNPPLVIQTSPADPHVWLSPIAMLSIIDAIKQALSLVDPAQRSEYEKNAKVIEADFRALNLEYAEKLRTCERRTVVVSHDAFRYLASLYNFHTIAISGLSPEEEPSAKTLADIADIVEQEKLGYVLTETLVSPKLAETIARETGAKILVLNPLEGLTEEERAAGETYMTVMRKNLSVLATALGCS